MKYFEIVFIDFEKLNSDKYKNRIKFVKFELKEVDFLTIILILSSEEEVAYEA